MNKKEWEEVIEKSVMKAIWTPIVTSLVVLAIFAVIIVSSILYQNYQQDKCIESGECVIPVLASSEPTISSIYCKFVIGNSSYSQSFSAYSFEVNTYQEAQAKFEILKPQVKELIINEGYYNENYGFVKFSFVNKTWDVKYLDCS